MACDAAFQIIARRALGALTANHEATLRGDPVTLHQMRIALTHLRTAILFFSPMVSDSAWTRIKSDLKWLNAHLGVLRDIDVAIGRLETGDGRRPQAIPCHDAWIARRAATHRGLARALRSARYRRLIKNASDWIEHGAWSTLKTRAATRMRASPVAGYCLRRLAQWERKLLKKSRKLDEMDTERRHRLRLLNKKLCYSIDSLEDLLADKAFTRQRTALKHLRKAQRALGQLNDDVRGRSLAAELDKEGIPAPLQFLSPKRERRLIVTAAAAYRKLAALE
jgi:CHAD domain-containing protein